MFNIGSVLIRLKYENNVFIDGNSREYSKNHSKSAVRVNFSFLGSV
jgi:hypothetical protein